MEIERWMQANGRAVDDWFAPVDHAIERLRSFPRLGRLAGGSTLPDLREIVAGAYRVTYLARTNYLLVVSLRHGRQRPARRSPLRPL
ncbi:MAG: type II toxin-antitoxin system RelE/ParE family toxin [Gemmatimonadetes bacterium]|nr:type II toxin-antitoxin system RelE/ParE family toxin [Gemmatimonadota bacterium]